ncbi:MAG: NupC/NupG family nucleoside CNT transporter [Candidatus Marinimicrobia bacterium]|jgi:CNT family concentrative nucleoside transporter|nr:NupC/NupG family nucleoside CNT transporter [Candidatus Neomarinimicrobiota bacterium]MBT3633902.1 NupC/NupG family nucleoside CNT transporter [Candidatus Neomarinimicrobiota bacterium]MBT3759965.1 NupC/NupG family nucleoside CNT transporter [Candidatus Neomarinimicrobiota bacterium]MBT3896059.1 NupC/NupG family nucleoside CNT transporter [Candidatus Neomarinimicrobiota bacterium]MBT4172831.1 NupC/NupG family nucleoside CNT transporter [Candidatus Neomarinimicrobiota bacterium]
MNLVSIGGLFTLLGIAWLLSYHKSSIKLKPIFWGLGLQFLFALIILRQDKFSFLGMIILGLLLVTYIMQKDDKFLGGGVKSMIIMSIGSILTGVVLYYIPVATYWVMIAALIYIAVNSIFQLHQPSQRFAGAIFVISGIAYLMTNDLYGRVIFKSFSDSVASFLSLSDYGAQFLFGNLANGAHFFPGPDAMWPGFGFQFAFKVLPTIVFFGGFMSVLYYLGIMQKVIQAMSKFMKWTIGTSGAETLSCSANIFVGQTEAPLLIKPFLNKMTHSELLTIMVGGFATIAGGVLAGYISMGVPAGHLVAASVMSAPAALVIGKIIYPELEHSETAGDVELPKISVGENVIEAAANGITDGLKLAVNVGAMLIGFIALIAVIDVILNWMDSIIDGSLLNGVYASYASSGMSPVSGEFAGFFPGSLQKLFGTILQPLAFMMGVPWQDASNVGNLLGIKLSLNEFVAYGTLGTYINEGVLSDRAAIIATYALCGFANFSSIGIQIGGISAIAPERRSALAKVGLKAMFGGAIASFLTATIAGILLYN